MLKEEFLNVYTLVFDEQGYVKLCGRHACIKLIKLANQIVPDTDYGNPCTGMMNLQALRDLHEKLTQE